MDTNESEKLISRRDFLKISGLQTLGVLSLPFAPYISGLDKSIQENEIDFVNPCSDELTSLGAVLSTINSFSKESDFHSKYPRSLQFIGKYYCNLGLNVAEYPRDIPTFSQMQFDYIPVNDIRMQIQHLNNLNNFLGRDLIAEVDLEDILYDSKIWEEIPPGTVMYMPNENIKQEYSYIAIFLGIEKKGSPIFAGLSFKPESNISLKELSSLYKGNKNDNLKVTLFDSVEASRRHGFEKGSVVPDQEFLRNLGFDIVTTVNINDGTLTVWDISQVSPKLIEIGDKKRIYCAVGRRLKRNESLSLSYWNSKYKTSEYSTFDGISGTHYENGIRRRTFTPPLIAEYLGHSVIQGFGGLGPDSSTDIAFLKPLHWDTISRKLVLGNYSSYTLHEIPRTDNPGVLGRLPMLIEANKKGKALDNPNLSAGCVNMDRDSYKQLVDELRVQKRNGKKIAVIFGLKGCNQRLLITPGSENMSFHSIDPFGGKSRNWDYNTVDDNGNSQERKKKYHIFLNR